MDSKVTSTTKQLKPAGYRHFSIWTGATIVGICAVLYAKLTALAQAEFLTWFGRFPSIVTLGSPFLFIVATFLVKRYAPEAKGSGIPQVLEAIEQAKSSAHSDGREWLTPLVSIRTAAIKVISSVVAVLGGASIGREGPTIQIAASVFAAIGRKVRRHSPHITMPSYLVAGAAAGVAAAFNTPIAGITFAIEEVLDGTFTSFRQTMLLAVIISGVVSQAFQGNYLYFGRPDVLDPDLHVIYQSLLIGVIGGTLGGIFSRILAYPKVTRLPEHWVLRTFICGVLCAGLGYFTHGLTAGSGYEPASEMLAASSPERAMVAFPLLKMLATLLSYLSGVAGGIFSPSLSIGAGVGISIAKLAHFANFKACALMGMVAFFSGVVQAPLTAVIIVTEMTDRHILILPFLVSAFLGQAIGRKIMPVPLYHFLAKRKEEG